MPTGWSVSYKLSKPLPVQRRVDEYRTLGISLDYDEHGKITALRHRPQTSEKLSEHTVMAQSQRETAWFFEVMRYWWGFPLDVRAVAAEKSDGDGRKGFAVRAIPVSVAISRPVKLPPDQAPSPRFVVWLRLANDARDTSDPSDAIRNYYLVWEDMKGRPSKTATGTEKKLKHVRDFVSHAEPIRSPELKAFLKKELGKPVTQYDPTDDEHTAYIKHYRNEARQLIEKELEQLL